MGGAEIGYTGAALVLTDNPLSLNKTDAGDEPTFTYHGVRANFEAAITALGISYGDAAPAPYANAKLRSIRVRSNGPTKVLVDYIYKLDNNGGQAQFLPLVGTVIKSGDSNPLSLPLGKLAKAPAGPREDGVNYDPDKKVGIGAWEGIEGWLDPQPTYTRREILGSFTFSQANLIASVGLRFSAIQMGTVGVSGATNDLWLQVSHRVTQVGDKFDKEEVWQHARKGWDVDIYDAKP